jgi:MFS family permease
MAAFPAESALYRSFPVPLGIVVFLAQVGLGIVLFAVFQEYVPGQLGAGTGWGGYLLAAYGGARFLSEVPTGVIVDRVRRRVALLTGFLVLVPAAGLMAPATNTFVFLGLSALLGLGTAFLWPAIYAISADLYPAERRGKVVGFLNVFQLLGFGAGALTGALTVERAHTAMFLVAILSIGAAGLAAFTLIPGYQHKTGGAPRRGIGLRAVWSRQLAVLSALVLVATAGVAMVVPAIRPYGEEQLGASFATVTIALIPGVLIGGALYVPAGHLSDRFGRAVPFLVGEALLVAGGLLIAATDVLVLAAAGGAIFFAGNVFIVPSFNAAVMDLAPESHRGTLIGLTVALSGLGLAVGPAVGGALAQAVSPAFVFQLSAAVAVVTGAGVYFYRQRFEATQRPVPVT